MWVQVLAYTYPHALFPVIGPEWLNTNRDKECVQLEE